MENNEFPMNQFITNKDCDFIKFRLINKKSDVRNKCIELKNIKVKELNIEHLASTCWKPSQTQLLLQFNNTTTIYSFEYYYLNTSRKKIELFFSIQIESIDKFKTEIESIQAINYFMNAFLEHFHSATFNNEYDEFAHSNLEINAQKWSNSIKGFKKLRSDEIGQLSRSKHKPNKFKFTKLNTKKINLIKTIILNDVPKKIYSSVQNNCSEFEKLLIIYQYTINANSKKSRLRYME